MKQDFKDDFLDILRFLNKENINQYPKLRDSFFKSLMVCANDAPEYLGSLSDAYFSEFEKEYMGNIAKNFMLSNLFGNEIKNQLTDHLIQDKVNYLYIDGRNAAHVLTYVGSIKGMRSLIETSSAHFDFFKESLLRGLMTRYCEDFASGRDKNPLRLSKLIGIYAEHIRHLEPSEEIPMIIDDEFLYELMDCRNNGGVNSKDSYRAVHNLINRKFPINTRENSPYNIGERRDLR